MSTTTKYTVGRDCTIAGTAYEVGDTFPDKALLALPRKREVQLLRQGYFVPSDPVAPPNRRSRPASEVVA